MISENKMNSPKLSIIIPAHNEEHRIMATLLSIKDYLSKVDYETEVIVVINNTTDNTRVVVENTKAVVPQLKCVDIGKFKHDSGTKGLAVRKGVELAEGEYIIFMDADNATKIEEIEKFWPYFANGCQVVFGSRYIKGAESHRVWYRRLSGFLANLLVQALLLPGIHDTQCGFKMFERDAAKNIFKVCVIDGWGFDLEVLALAKRMGYKMKEAPIVWNEIGNSSLKAGAFLSTLSELSAIISNLRKNKYNLNDEKK
jgi:dolichyl-phosphate beta-glucosyltransferase